ncbi:hypothetical protein C1N63_12855 [Pantoea ananatis]|nr:hypothetical protein C1N63_12855 [Pantoea ananatis]
MVFDYQEPMVTGTIYLGKVNGIPITTRSMQWRRTNLYLSIMVDRIFLHGQKVLLHLKKEFLMEQIKIFQKFTVLLLNKKG